MRQKFARMKSMACVSHIFVASPDTRHSACPLSSKELGRQRARRAHRPALSPPSLCARGCLLPAVLCVRRIPYRAMTGATHGTPLPPLGRRDPAPILARDNVARWGELHVVTASAGTAQRHRLGLPDLIMPVSLPHEGMGDLMQEGVVNVRVWGCAGIRMGKGDDLRLIVTAARACRGVIKLETPALELVLRDPGGGTPRNGLEVAVRTLACARRRGGPGVP